MEPICERCSHAKESHNGRCRIRFTNGVPCRCTTFVFPLPPSKTAYGGYPMPKILPAPTRKPEAMAKREWSRYQQTPNAERRKPRPDAACKCGHPYSAHNRECLAYDPLSNIPWCGCGAFKIVDGKFLERIRIPVEELRAFEKARIYDSMSKTTPRMSKTTSTLKVKSKKTSKSVDKLTLTRVPPVLDEEV